MVTLPVFLLMLCFAILQLFMLIEQGIRLFILLWASQMMDLLLSPTALICFSDKQKAGFGWNTKTHCLSGAENTADLRYLFIFAEHLGGNPNSSREMEVGVLQATDCSSLQCTWSLHVFQVAWKAKINKERCIGKQGGAGGGPVLFMLPYFSQTFGLPYSTEYSQVF